jgi:hypothetical protein
MRINSAASMIILIVAAVVLSGAVCQTLGLPWPFALLLAMIGTGAFLLWSKP